jgi:hypothetical protein
MVSITVWQLQAQPISGRILSNVSVEESADGSTIHIEFTFPVRYLRHFPADYGDTIEISLKEVAISDVDEQFLKRRESIRLPESISVPLLDVNYEGDLPGGPYLTLRFYKPVAYTVRQGSDFRSLTVYVFNDHASID